MAQCALAGYQKNMLVSIHAIINGNNWLVLMYLDTFMFKSQF